MIRVLVADDHPMMRSGIIESLSAYKDITIVAEVADGKEALEKIAKTQPDLVLLDIQMPNIDGIECAKEILKNHSRVKIIMLSMLQEKIIYNKTKELGAHGYLLKNYNPDQVYKAITTVMSGKKYFNVDLTTFEAPSNLSVEIPPNNQEKLKLLSKREKEILKHLALGMSSTEISKVLFISVYTVDTHRRNMMNKLEIHKVTGLIRFAFSTGIA